METIVSRNPLSGEVLGEVPIFSRERVLEEMERVRLVQREWAELSVEERVRYLERLGEVLVRRRDELAGWISRENGKPALEALLAEIFTLLGDIEFLVSRAPSLLASRRVSHRVMKTVQSEVWFEPYGVVGIISPWNYPFFLSFAPALSALVAGNGVMIKPSEFTPLCVSRIPELCREAGIPEGLVVVLTGDGSTGEALLEARPDRVCFTGSVSTGRKVASRCGELLIPVTLELGGKDPMIVLEDAPLERAVNCALWSGFSNAGQICASTERIYVRREVASVFARRLAEAVNGLRLAKVGEVEFDVGPISNERQFEVIRRQVEEAKAAGVEVLAGGEGECPFFVPTVLWDPSEELLVLREETFGPVVSVIPVEDDEEALELANRSSYGLTASVWSGDLERARSLARRLEAGAVYINEALSPSGAAELSWGGVKGSGFGKTRGEDGLFSMVRKKYVSRDLTGMSTAPHWYPYTEEKYRRFSELVEDLYGGNIFRRLLGFFKFVWLTFRGE